MISKIYNQYFSSKKDFALKVKSLVGFIPKKLHLFQLAFYHKSMNNGQIENSQHNERLEFLGDSILNAIVAEYLFEKYPTKDEGFLTKMRSKIVKRKTLNEIASNMQLDLILAEFSNGKLSNTMLGNALEALVGAIYLEKGYKRTKSYVIDQIILKHLEIDTIEKLEDNFKSYLLEWGQKSNARIEFRLVNKYKVDKRDKFKIAIYVNGEIAGESDDYNKKSAEQSAAKKALKYLNL